MDGLLVSDFLHDFIDTLHVDDYEIVGFNPSTEEQQE
jgi:hypothetical protein